MENPIKMDDLGLPSLKLTANAPENGWLEYCIRFLLGQKAYFQGQTRCSFQGGYSPSVSWSSGRGSTVVGECKVGPKTSYNWGEITLILT